jgi:outer membrane receptor protein involved in Fe transport
MILTKQTTVVWLSKDDMGGNNDLNQERSNQLSIMVKNNLTDGVVSKNDAANTVSIKFIDTTSAQTWINFVETLAKEYDKTIISATITSL